MWCLVQINCSPHPSENFPIPTTFRIVKVFGSQQDAMSWGEPRIHKADTELQGQDVYQLVYNTEEALNIDRYTNRGDRASSVGMWLPESKQIHGDTKEVELIPVPTERLRERARRKADLQRRQGGARRNGGSQTDSQASRVRNYPHARGSQQLKASMINRQANSGQPYADVPQRPRGFGSSYDNYEGNAGNEQSAVYRQPYTFHNRRGGGTPGKQV